MINELLDRLSDAYPQASDFVVNPEEILVISSKRVIYKERGNYSQAVEEVVFSIPEKIQDLDTSWKTGKNRYRLNVARYDGNKYELTFRWLKDVKWKIQDYGFDDVIVKEIFNRVETKKGGLFLVIGPTGSGKSTVMASILNGLLERLPVRVITIEDPVEYRLEEGQGSVLQREVGSDTPSFNRALKSALRQNPNVIFVGEIRDRETVKLLLEASDTGHTVFATMHTDSPKDAIERILGMVDTEQHAFILQVLQKILVGVLGLRMYDYQDRKLMLYEYMSVATDPAIKSLIQQKKFMSIPTYMAVIENGHRPFEYTLAKNIKEGKVRQEDIENFGFEKQKVISYIAKVK